MRYIRILGYAIKYFTLLCLLDAGLSKYESGLPYYDQNIMVWLLLYIPAMMGYESLINVITSVKPTKEDKQATP